MNVSTSAIAFLLAILPALAWLIFYYHKDSKEPEPKALILQTFLAGALMAVPFLLLRSVLIAYPQMNLVVTGVTTVFIFAALEELAKLSAAIYIISHHRFEFNQLIDGVVYAVTAALGFAFVENKIYFYEFLNNSGDQLTTVFLFRSLGTMLAHTLFSAIAGLIWAYAYFSKKISPFNKEKIMAFRLKDFINKEILSLHIIRQNILKARPSRRGGHDKKILVLEGIVLATFLHVIFNLTTTFEVMGQSLTFLLVPALMGGLLYVSYLYTKKRNTKILKVV